MPQFSHLHVHTQYSLLDGAASIPDLYKKANTHQMPAIAITDHGNMFGVFEFVSEAWKDTIVTGKDENGKDIKKPRVKPIVGCEFYVVEDRFKKIFTKEQKDKRYHQVLLAKNEKGYQNLVKLTSLGFIEGNYSKYPRIDKQLIEQYHEGLIATTCCIGAYVPQKILNDTETAAETEFKWWLDLFGEDYFIEIQRHNIPEQEQINATLLQLAKKYNVPVIATNDSHYTEITDFNAHDILLCINTGEKQATPGFDDFVNEDAFVKNRRFKFPNNQFYFKTPEEMQQLFADIPESLDNTNIIVDKVEILNLNRDILLPAFQIPPSFQVPNLPLVSQWNYLKHLTFEGAKRKYGEINEITQTRIDFELEVIDRMGFAGYFLIVSDFIQEGKKMGVFVGPGRGSAAGSVVAFCLGITNIDPIKYDLLFERFLNPDRSSMPDIDTDFDDEGRQRVIDYVVAKYGKAQVAQIVTYGTMAAKMSIKDVARVMDLPLSESNMLAKMVPDKPGIALKRVLTAPFTKKEGADSIEEYDLPPEDIENIKKLREFYKGSDIIAKVLKEAERLEGSVRNTGIHAAGIIIAPSDLTDLIPVCVAKDSDLLVTQFEGKIIENAGVIKMDFLGLKTLSILKTAIELIKENYNVTIDLDTLPLDDVKTFQLYQKGETNATFQFESVGMQKCLRDLKPDKLTDLIAMNALYRPGPLQYIPTFVDRKHGRQPIIYDLPETEEFLADTYGITVYQEQVMLLSQKLGNFTKGQADKLRKAMGKKDKAAIDQLKNSFIQGATSLGHPITVIEKIWTDWEAFAHYAFNKSHATCYAVVAYQTAYLKANYPSEYMSAVLNHSGSIEKITFHMEECRRMGIKVLGPDINESKKGFAPNKNGEIRFGLGGLKGVGEAAIESLIEERNTNGTYNDIFHFIKRVNQRTVNKKSIESLIYSGAFDCFKEYHRAQYFAIPKGEKESGIEKIIRYGNIVQNQSEQTTNTLFGNLEETVQIQIPKIPNSEPWTLTELLNHEKQVTGMFMSGHPLDHFHFELTYYRIVPLSIYNEMVNGNEPTTNKPIRLAGLVTSFVERTNKSGKNFGIVTIEDYGGKAEFRLYGNEYGSFHSLCKVGLNVFIEGVFKAKMRRVNEALVEDGLEFKISRMQLLETIRQSMSKQIELQTDTMLLSMDVLDALESTLQKNKGRFPLKLIIKDNIRNYEVAFNFPQPIDLTDEMVQFLQTHKIFEVKVVNIGD